MKSQMQFYYGAIIKTKTNDTNVGTATFPHNYQAGRRRERNSLLRSFLISIGLLFWSNRLPGTVACNNDMIGQKGNGRRETHFMSSCTGIKNYAYTPALSYIPVSKSYIRRGKILKINEVRSITRYLAGSTLVLYGDL